MYQLNGFLDVSSFSFYKKYKNNLIDVSANVSQIEYLLSFDLKYHTHQHDKYVVDKKKTKKTCISIIFFSILFVIEFSMVPQIQLYM